MEMNKKIKVTAAKKAEIAAAVKAGEILVHPEHHEDNEGEVEVMDTKQDAPKAKKSEKTPKKAEKKVSAKAETTVQVSPIKLGEKTRVDSVSTGTLVLKMDLLAGIELKSGDQVVVDGNARTISNVTKYAKKNQISIATSGFGKWPVGSVEVEFKTV